MPRALGGAIAQTSEVSAPVCPQKAATRSASRPNAPDGAATRAPQLQIQNSSRAAGQTNAPFVTLRPSAGFIVMIFSCQWRHFSVDISAAEMRLSCHWRPRTPPI